MRYRLSGLTGEMAAYGPRGTRELNPCLLCLLRPWLIDLVKQCKGGLDSGPPFFLFPFRWSLIRLRSEYLGGDSGPYAKDVPKNDAQGNVAASNTLNLV